MAPPRRPPATGDGVSRTVPSASNARLPRGDLLRVLNGAERFMRIFDEDYVSEEEGDEWDGGTRRIQEIEFNPEGGGDWEGGAQIPPLEERTSEIRRRRKWRQEHPHPNPDPMRDPELLYRPPPSEQHPPLPSPPGFPAGVFDIYQALLRHHEIMAEFSSHLYVDQMVSLYAICKDFHKLVNRRYTATMLANARNRAPESARIFHWKCYRDMCIYDPACNLNQKVGVQEEKKQLRDVPGFHWLSMVTYREQVVDSIIFELAEQGHRLPRRATSVIKKIWFLMDMPDNARRVGLIHNSNWWSDLDLYVASMFFMKLDMRFSAPMNGKTQPFLRKLMLAQRTLSVLDRVLTRDQLQHSEELAQMFVEWMGREPPVLQIRGEARAGENDLFGVPRSKVGSLQCEDWTKGNTLMLRPDELVMREGIRRELELERWYMDMMLFGYINADTGKDVWPPSTEMALKIAKKELGEKAEAEGMDVEDTGGVERMEVDELDSKAIDQLEGMVEAGGEAVLFQSGPA